MQLGIGKIGKEPGVSGGEIGGGKKALDTFTLVASADVVQPKEIGELIIFKPVSPFIVEAGFESSQYSSAFPDVRSQNLALFL